jgi:hypothetical protein
VGRIREIVMPQQAAQQGQAAIQGGSRPSAGPRIPEGRASSRSKVIGVGVAGALLTAAAIAGVVMMMGSASPPSAVAPTFAVAPATVSTPFEPAQATALATSVATALSPVAAPPPAPAISDIAQSLARFVAPSLNAPDQCEIGQRQQLSMTLFSSRRSGNVIRIHSGSYVSPPIVLTRFSQTVTFPVPPGSRGWTRIIIEQSKANGGSTYADDEDNGITIEHEGRIDPYRDVDLLRWTTPRC